MESKGSRSMGFENRELSTFLVYIIQCLVNKKEKLILRTLSREHIIDINKAAKFILENNRFTIACIIKECEILPTEASQSQKEP